MRLTAIAAAAALLALATVPAQAQDVCPRYSACLTWTPPTHNTDGTALTNLSGYRVHYGRSPDQLTQSVQLADPGLTAYRIDGLSAGTWYFAVRALSSSGGESVLSNMGAKTVRNPGPTDGSIIYQ